MTFFDIIYEINEIMYVIEDKFLELRHVGEFRYEVIVPNKFTSEFEVRLTITPYDDGEDEEFDIFLEDTITLKFERDTYDISTLDCINDYSECIESLNDNTKKIFKLLMNNKEY